MDTMTLLAFVAGVVLGPVLLIAGIYAFVYVKVKLAMRSAGAEETPELPPPPLTSNAPVPLDFSVETLDGAPVDVAALAGERPIVLNMWATWCGPCVAEWPTLERLHDEVGAEVALFLLSDESAEEIRAFVARGGFRAPVYRLVGALPPALQADGVPATFVLDRSRRVAASAVGAANWAHPSVVSFLRGLVGAPRLSVEGDCDDGVCAVSAAGTASA